MASSPPQSTLEALAPEILECIAFHIVTSTFLGPPSDLIPLLCVSKRINKALAYTTNTHLYASIFRFKFDDAAPIRRLSSRWVTTTCLAVELRRRFAALKRIKQSIVLTASNTDDLWTAYLMMLEGDGRNESQLIDWANIGYYVRWMILHRVHTRRGSASLWYGDTIGTALVVWLLWMTDDQNSVREEDPRLRLEINKLLHPFLVRGYQYPSFHGPDSHFDLPLCQSLTEPSPHCTGAPPKTVCLTYFTHPLTISAPVLTLPALLCTTARIEVQQDASPLPPSSQELPPDRASAVAQGLHGPTLEDVVAFHRGTRTKFAVRPPLDLAVDNDGEPRQNGSRRYEKDWHRLVSCHDIWAADSPLRGVVFSPGSLSGTWNGRYLAPMVEPYFSLLANSNVPSSAVPIALRPLQCCLKEHHCLRPDTPLRPGIAADELGDDILNAWFPKDITVRHLEDAIEIYDPMTERHIRYETYFPERPAPYSSAACEKLQTPWLDPMQATTDSELADADEDVSYIDEDEEWQDTVQHQTTGIADILVTGETSEEHGEAWGRFTFIGRVRPWDGMVVLLRQPREEDESRLGRWIFKGYVMNGMLVGRWRETGTGVDLIGFEGSFVMCKNDDS